jgi:hypothetical protein
MFALLLWLILLVICWPVALLALLVYPIVWLLLLPLRLFGFAAGVILQTIWSIATLPARISRARPTVAPAAVPGEIGNV